MASPAQQEPWTDFDVSQPSFLASRPLRLILLAHSFQALRHSIKSHTVDRLKQIIQGLSEENNLPLSKSGKKQDLIDRIVAELDKYRMRRSSEEWNRARTVLYQVKNTGR